MTRVSIDHAPAGPALDAAVAEAKTGKKWEEGWIPGRLPYPVSTDIAAAWDLVDSWIAKGDKNTFDIVSSRDPELRWLAFFESDKSIMADTAPLAITRAYLKAKGVEEVEVPDTD